MFAIFGCSSRIQMSAYNNPGDLLRKRVIVAWDARVEADWNKIYDMASSRYKDGVSRQKHLQRSRLVVKQYRLGDISLSPEGKSALTTVRFDVEQMGRLVTNVQIQEKWQLEQDQWVLDLPPAQSTPFKFKKPE